MKQKRYWLRGGVMFGVIYTFIFFVTYTGIGVSYFDSLHLILASIVAIPAILFVSCPDFRCIDIGIPSDFMNGVNRFFEVGTHWVFLINLLFYITLGIFFGWLYGRIKNRNKV